MRESFIFHAEYIQDIPEDLQPTYAMYAINYALKDIEPDFTDWRDLRDWNKVKTRIDSDIAAWNETKQARSNAGKKHTGNQYTRKKQMEQCSNSSKPVEQDGTNGTVSVFVSESVSVNESVSDCVSVNDYESYNAPLLNTHESYAKRIFNLYKELGLPCCNGNESLWTSTEFSKAYDTLQRCYKGLHSDDLMKAIRNYSFMIKDNRVYSGFLKRIRTFSSFVSWERFTDFMPGTFDMKNFIDRSEKNPEKKTVGANRAIELLREVQSEQKRIPE